MSDSVAPSLSVPSRRGRRGAEVALALALLALLLAAPFYVGTEFALRIATLCCLFGTMSLGWNLLGGYANQISLGHAVFFAVGAYTTGLLEIDLHVTPWLGIPAGMGLAVLVGIGIGIPTFRLAGHYFALGTLALLQIGDILFTYYRQFTGGTLGLTLPILGYRPEMFSFKYPIWYFYVAAGMMVGALLASRLVLRSGLGYRLRAIKENPLAAQLAGIDLLRTKLTALAISAAVVAAGGGFYLQFIQFIDPDSAFSFQTSINMALFAIIGGVNSWWGPALGAMLLVPLSEYTSLQLTGRLAPLGPLAYGLLLILVILLRPRGLAEWLLRLWERLWRSPA
ncbi:MAG TPA: branched-chain amino acid ABC transporter permease [Candidatus Dormibacteraeota bacterium]|jgi:branched-chain amino acid transport system permease protein|nr:branched-chain amino acid ABC transporter permease [Candidatus Dormibacteraeota bacterium]